MQLQEKCSIINLLIFLSLCMCENLSFNINLKIEDDYNDKHWKHSSGNSSISINGIEIDVINIRVAAKSANAILINPIWKPYANAINDLNLPDIIKINKPMNFRGQSMVYIEIFPWRVHNGKVEILANGEIQINFHETEEQVKLLHPHSLNTAKYNLNRNTNETQYLIICPNDFLAAAQKIANIHSNEIHPTDHQLITNVYTIEQINATYENLEKNLSIRQYLFDTYQLSENDGALIFLLLLGDETYIPPIFDETNNYPSDDYYSTPELYSGDPQLITGRIPINNINDANKIADKIYDYIINPTPGMWRSKFGFIADDMYKSCSLTNTEMERSHTIYTDSLYTLLSPLVPAESYYGIHYDIEQNNNCTKPNLTQELINNINNGFALINYIGHGTNQSWGDENYLNKSRDLSLIHPKENKSAIWVAGTCSFGDYYANNSFMEELLIKENGAIAIIATTDGIDYTSNWHFLKNLFGIHNNHGIEDFINGTNISTSIPYYSLGELVWKAKNLSYKFHVFGDPALPLPFPNNNNNIIQDISEIKILENQELTFTSSEIQSSSMQLRKSNNKIIKIIDSDTISYDLSEIYTQMNFHGPTNCYRISQDMEECNDCVTMYVYESTESNEKIQTINDISIIAPNNFHSDTEGPNIYLHQNNIEIKNGSAIFSNLDITATLSDLSGINLIESIGHGVKYSFNDKNLTTIHANEFTYQNCDTGHVTIPIPLSTIKGRNVFYIEAWDGLNNKSFLELELDLLTILNENEPLIEKVYPIPNPFSDQTYFTMISTYIPIHITINIYTINGFKVQTIQKNITECHESFSNDLGCFIKLNWNGKDKYGHGIANGTYLYHLEATFENGKKFKNIYKIAKIK